MSKKERDSCSSPSRRRIERNSKAESTAAKNSADKKYLLKNRLERESDAFHPKDLFYFVAE